LHPPDRQDFHGPPDEGAISTKERIMSTPASFARHPIHPMLVAIPIGLWVFSVAADVIYHAGWGRGAWSDAAFYAIGGGIVGALLAAIPGFIDYLSITDARVRTIGLYHMVANLMAVAIFGLSFWLRWIGTIGLLPMAISVAALVLLGIAGWLGGELVFVHGMGVKPPRAAPREQGSRNRAA
jgi:uncharacterized membrane protein